ncbi:MAG: hypothetical protein AAFV86_23565, partial [Pseudomonadota bacterium]
GNYSLQVNDETYTSQNERVAGMTFNMLHNLQSNAAETATESMIEYTLAYEEIEVSYDDGGGAVEADDSWLKPAVGQGSGGGKEPEEPAEETGTYEPRAADSFDFL